MKRRASLFVMEKDLGTGAKQVGGKETRKKSMTTVIVYVANLLAGDRKRREKERGRGVSFRNNPSRSME